MIKQGILIIVLCCFAGSWAMAQRGQVKGMKSSMTEETKTALNLSAQQLADLDVLQAQTAKALESSRQENEDRGAAMREIKEADEAGLEEILTADQMATLHNIRMERSSDRPVQENRVRERVRTDEVDRERVRPEAKLEDDRERVRPDEVESERVLPEAKPEEDLERVRPEEEERERVRPEEDIERERPDEVDRERVRPDSRPKRDRGERVRPEREDRRQGMDAGDRERMQEEIRNYNQNNVEPAKQAQRQKLDGYMSAEDRARLATLRSQLSSDRAQQNEEVIAMVNKYDRQITSLLTELQPREAQWKTDQDRIRAKYMDTSSNNRTRTSESGETEYRSVGNQTLDMDDKIRFLLRNSNQRRNR